MNLIGHRFGAIFLATATESTKGQGKEHMRNAREVDRQFEQARHEVDKASDTIMRAIERLLARTTRLDGVARDFVVERPLLALLHEHDFVSLLDRMGQPGPSTIRLGNALHDYRDSQCVDR